MDPTVNVDYAVVIQLDRCGEKRYDKNVGIGRLKPVSNKDLFLRDFLKVIVDRASGIEPGSRILVFGSFSQDRMTEESDLDVAVVLPLGTSESTFRERWRVMDPLTGWPFDLVVLEHKRFESRKDYGGLCFDIHHDGIELYPEWTL